MAILTDDNYVDKAENVIKSLNRNTRDSRNPEAFLLTTSKIRNLLSLTSTLFDESKVREYKDLADKIAYLRVQFVYQSGRETAVKDLVKKAEILDILKEINNKESLQRAKIQVTAQIRLETGLHIGTSNAFAAIGATDSPVIKDPITNLPIIPGSSIKGKMRSLLSKVHNERLAKKPGEDGEILSRLFGNSSDNRYKMGRLIFRDAFLINKDKLDSLGVKSYTEVKFENTIDRITAEANPRQIERAIRESAFAFELIYEITDDSEDQVEEDFKVILDGLKLLELDYLGGSGSRGYGKVVFEDLKANTVFGNYDVSRLNELLTTEV